jgi:hypothetical protein
MSTQGGVPVPDRIVLTASVAGRALQGAFFELELPMSKKNSFRILLGPADESGTSSVTRPELLAKARQEADFFPMDYAGLEAGWTGEVVVQVVDRAAIRRLRRAFATWGATGAYPEGFSELLDQLDSRLASNASPEVVDVAVEVEPSDARVRVVRRVVGEGTSPS